MIIGSNEEKDLSREIKQKLDKNAVDVCGKLTLLQSIALIKQCSVLLCNDGGLLHIGVSQGVRTISIFGPVDDMIYGPYPASEKHKVIKAEGIECRPCYKRFKYKECETHDCLKKIDRDRVLETLEKSLETQMGTDREYK